MAGKDKGADAFDFDFEADGKDFGSIPGEEALDGLDGGFEQLPEQNGFMGAPDADQEFTDVEAAAATEGFGGANDFGTAENNEGDDAAAGYTDENEGSAEGGDDFESFGTGDSDESEDGEDLEDSDDGIAADETEEESEQPVAAANSAKKRSLLFTAASVAALGVVGYVGYAAVLPMFTKGSSAPKAPVARPQPQTAAPTLNGLPAFPPSAPKPQAPAVLAQPQGTQQPLVQPPSLVQPPLVQQPAVQQPTAQAPVQADPQVLVPTGSLNRPAQVADPAAVPAIPAPVPSAPAAAALPSDSLKTIETSVSQVLAEVREMNRRLSRLEDESVSKSEVAAKFDTLNSRIAELESRAASKNGTPVRPAAPAPASRPVVPPAAPAPSQSFESQPRTVRGAGILPPLKPAVIDGYSLKGVSRGVAWVATSGGVQEVAVGRSLPGAGLVKAIEQIDGEWVVVAERGVIVP